jgi:hypothetical protein
MPFLKKSSPEIRHRNPSAFQIPQRRAGSRLRSQLRLHRHPFAPQLTGVSESPRNKRTLRTPIPLGQRSPPEPEPCPPSLHEHQRTGNSTLPAEREIVMPPRRAQGSSNQRYHLLARS